MSQEATSKTKPAAPEAAPPPVFCPVCCSNQDAENWGLNELECVNCDTTYTVVLDVDIVAQHSMY